MTRYTDFTDDDYPEGIDAGTAFDPSHDHVNIAETAIAIGGTVFIGAVIYLAILPWLREAATAAILLASAR